jgi:hypothetical protein
MQEGGTYPVNMSTVLGAVGFWVAAIASFFWWVNFAGSLPAGRYPVILILAIYIIPAIAGGLIGAGIGHVMGSALDNNADAKRKAADKLSEAKGIEGTELVKKGKGDCLAYGSDQTGSEVQSSNFQSRSCIQAGEEFRAGARRLYGGDTSRSN